jgi:ankyrin repeat protein
VKSTSDIECFPLKPDHRVVAEMLIRKGAQVNSKDQFGSTPLHWAAYYGTKETVEALLNNGAEINTPTKSGMTPLDIAQGEDNTEAIAVLKSRGGKASEPQP